jgi:hypothetical protein
MTETDGHRDGRLTCGEDSRGWYCGAAAFIFFIFDGLKGVKWFEKP